MSKQFLLTFLLICAWVYALSSDGRCFPAVNAAHTGAKLNHNRDMPKWGTTLEPKSSDKELIHLGLPNALLAEVRTWVETVDFWKLIERAERLAIQIEIQSVKSNILEAWVCGQTKICVSTRLLSEFQPEAQHAVIAHELGHLLIPRNYEAHPQLWEAQCDLFAAAFLRDTEQMKEMLLQLADECPNCRDREHPAPGARAALLDRYSSNALTSVLKFDEFRTRSYTVQYREKQRRIPNGLQKLNFAIQTALSVR